MNKAETIRNVLMSQGFRINHGNYVVAVWKDTECIAVTLHEENDDKTYEMLFWKMYGKEFNKIL